jgi:2-polyprenyl-3-methyl-5-hydroxy-6-metoxy-1,4-benzoquinol methylase
MAIENCQVLLTKGQKKLNTLQVWGFNVPCSWVSNVEAEYLTNLPQTFPTVQWVWEELDHVWQLQNLDNKRPLVEQPIGAYYGHPVWLMNGIFTAIDPDSVAHRTAIARYLKLANVKSIADYGGGFGELALAVSHAIEDASVSIIEPYPSKFALERLRSEASIKFVSAPEACGYDAVIAQDVLEHVEDPLGFAYQIATSTHAGGKIIFANCFYSVIQCHLPATFHMRHTFPLIMNALGLHYLGRVEGAAHAQIFERVGELNINKARRIEAVSRVIGSPLNNAYAFLAQIKHKVLKL